MTDQKDGLAQDESARGLVVDECIAAIREHYGFSDDEKSIAVAVLDALKPSMATLTPAEGEEAHRSVERECWDALESHGFPPEACDYLPHAIDNAISCMAETREDLIKQRDQALALVENARAAIEPFSKLVAAMYESGHCGGASPEDWPDTWHVGIEGRDHKGNIYVHQQWGGSLTVGDFRKLSTALTSTVYQPEPAGFCPCCNGIATKYPDGRRTCVRCEWEEAATTNSPHERKASTDV